MKWFAYITLFIAFPSFGQTSEMQVDIAAPPVMGTAVGQLFEELPNDPEPEYSIKYHSSLKPAIRQHHKKPGNFGEVSLLADWNYLNPSNSSYAFGEYKTGIGGQFESVYKKWYFRLAAVQGVYETSPRNNPKSYLSWKSGKSNLYTDVRSRISFTPNHIFNFQAGVDHNFIGEGSRSLFLSDYGKPYPFGLIRARFWRMEYSILYQFMREGQTNDWESKFMSTHHISFNAAKWLNFGIFETVVFQPKDTLLNRGFDAEYLNPFVFYRPQEYSLGSSDNVLLGVEMSAKWKKHMFYAQFVLDEFFLAEIRARSGWWANKFGGQFGIKGRFQYGKHKFFYRTELNFMRPYTYAHLSDELNYGNQGMPLAHIYGSNFAEILGELKWQNGKWGAKIFTNYSLHGGNKDGFNYGADIYLPYINRPYEKGHFIGQGEQRNYWRAQLSGNYQILKRGNLNAFIENNFLYNVQENRMDYTLVVGLRSLLWNDYRNY